MSTVVDISALRVEGLNIYRLQYVAQWTIKCKMIFLILRESLTLQPPNYLIGIFIHLKLCLADAIHNFKWVKIIQIGKNVGQQILNFSD